LVLINDRVSIRVAAERAAPRIGGMSYSISPPVKVKDGLTVSQSLYIIKGMKFNKMGIVGLLIVAIITTGTIGYQLIEGWSLSESVYMTVITISTVGFGEVRPLSAAGKIFTVALILCGVASITTGVSLIFSSIIEGTFGELMRRQGMTKRLIKMRDHFVICGAGVVGEDIIQEFIRLKSPFVLVEKSEDVINPLFDQYPKTTYVIGDATDDEVLKAAGIAHAKGIITVLGNDADNLYVCMSARSLNPRLRIITRAIESEATNKLKKAGADYVFATEKIGGLRLAEAALRPAVTSFLDAILKGEYYNLVLDEVEVTRGSLVAGKTLKDSEISKNIGVIIPAIKTAGSDRLVFNPSSETVIGQGDVLIAFGSPAQIKLLKKISQR
jgi:voltage-gated potassium channel